MSDIFETLITDRKDINCYYNISDLNRVEEAVKQLAERMTNEGYYVTAKPKKATVINDIQDPTDPISIQRVEYLQSTGAEFIDTGVYINQNTRIVIDFEVLEGNTSQAHICSVRTNGGTPLSTLYYNTNGTYGTRIGTTAVKSFSAINGVGRHVFDRNGATISVDNGLETLTSADLTEFSIEQSLPIFCRNDGTAYNGFIIGRVYSCKIYDNGELVRDFVPCADANGIGFLLEQISGARYYNAGNGSFVLGNEITTAFFSTSVIGEDINPNEWNYYDMPTDKEMQRYIDNILTIRQQMAQGTLPLPTTMENFGFVSANNIEKLLIVVDDLMKRMTTQYRYCNTFRCGERR